MYHNLINIQTNQEGFESTKAKDFIKIYTVDSMSMKKLLNSHDELGMQNTSLSRKLSTLNILSIIKTEMNQVFFKLALSLPEERSF